MTARAIHAIVIGTRRVRAFWFSQTLLFPKVFRSQLSSLSFLPPATSPGAAQGAWLLVPVAPESTSVCVRPPLRDVFSLDCVFFLNPVFFIEILGRLFPTPSPLSIPGPWDIRMHFVLFATPASVRQRIRPHSLTDERRAPPDPSSPTKETILLPRCVFPPAHVEPPQLMSASPAPLLHPAAFFSQTPANLGVCRFPNTLNPPPAVCEGCLYSLVFSRVCSLRNSGS